MRFFPLVCLTLIAFVVLSDALPKHKAVKVTKKQLHQDFEKMSNILKKARELKSEKLAHESNAEVEMSDHNDNENELEEEISKVAKKEARVIPKKAVKSVVAKKAVKHEVKNSKVVPVSHKEAPHAKSSTVKIAKSKVAIPHANEEESHLPKHNKKVIVPQSQGPKKNGLEESDDEDMEELQASTTSRQETKKADLKVAEENSDIEENAEESKVRKMFFFVS